MHKNIVLCSDGTGNSGGKGRGTNVWRIFNAIDLNGHKWDLKKCPQVAFHDDGVGTQSNVLLKILGGALGFGLKRNIREIYTFLVKNYNPGDRIYLLGFSRGAYTIRAVAGMIAQLGIIDRRKYDDEELKRVVRRAVAILRGNFQRSFVQQFSSAERLEKRKESLTSKAGQFRQECCVEDDVHAPDGLIDIAFVGVWDTVDAYGFPFDHLADLWHYLVYPFRFPDTKISDRIQHAAQAISIDDERHTFHPVLWDENETTVNRVNQVWFPGVHSNVGGGYPKDGLALVSLDWMMSQAEDAGLRFLKDDRTHIQNSANGYDKLYNSRSGAAIFYRYQPRNLAEICEARGIDVPKIHDSTFQRIRSSVEGYGPGNLPTRFQIVCTDHKGLPKEESERWMDQLKKNVESKLATPLLQEVSSYVHLRRFLHYIFLGITLAVLIMAWRFRDAAESAASIADGSGLAGIGQFFGSIPEWLFSFLITPFVAQPLLTVPPILGTLVLIWAVGVRAKLKMHRKFLAFWRKAVAEADQ